MKVLTTSRGTYRLLLVLALLILPFSYIAYQAVWNPEIKFLPISSRADWALHPLQEILNTRGNPVSKDVAFRTQFDPESVATQRQLVARAFTEMEILLNGQILYKSPPGHNWKIAVSVDMSMALIPGRNLLEIRVRNKDSLPALLVEKPEVLRTRGSWKASLGPEYTDYQGVVSPLQDGPPRPLDSAVHDDPGPFYTGNPQWLRSVVLVWLTLIGALAICLFPRMWTRTTRVQKQIVFPRWLRIAVPSAILGGIFVLHLYNAFRYPVDRDPFDLDGHLTYIKYVSDTWRVPHPTQGWEMYQPPLYYYCAAAVYSLAGGDSHLYRSVKAVQLFGAVIAWGLQLVTWLCARYVFPERPMAQWVALLFSAFVPMCLYTSPLVSNEPFAATAIALSLYGLIRLSKNPDISTLGFATVGFLTGLALLAKYTGLFIFLAGALFLFLRTITQNRLRSWVNLGVYIAAVLLVSGWFYARNVAEYGAPFIGNWDKATGFQYHQNPGYRSAGFYLRFGKVFFHHPERAPWISWADGNYASMWADVYRAFLSSGDPNVYFVVVIQLLIAVLPSLALFFGFLATLRSVWDEPTGNINLLFISFSLWLLQSLIFFSLELPFGSTIKAFFFLSLIPAFSIYLVRGRDIFSRQSRFLTIALDLSLLALAGLSTLMYRYSG